MSFCSDVKNEMCSIKEGKRQCLAELYGIMLFANTFNKREIRLVTETEAVALRTVELLEYCFNITPEIKTGKRKDGSIFVLSVNEPGKASVVFKTFSDDPKLGRLSINHSHFTDESCRISFLRGAFLSGGTLSSPEKNYYLDFTTPSIHLAKSMETFLLELELKPKTIVRRYSHVIYFKGSENIEQLLQLLGATNCYFEFLNIKIEKEVRNGFNRTLNCDSANAQRAMSAAKKQIKAIKKLRESGRLDSLTAEMRGLAELRLENEDASLSELGEMLTPKLTKTAVYNRLKKMEAMAETLTEGETKI